MIELTQLDGNPFILNSDLIETLENIPETKVLLTNGKYYIVSEDRKEIVRRVVAYKRQIFRQEALMQQPPEQEFGQQDGGPEEPEESEESEEC